MAKVEVELARWVGDCEAAPGEDHTVLAILNPRVDGEVIREIDFELRSDGFITAMIRNPSDSLRAKYGPDDYLIETNNTELHLPVTELEVTRRP